MDGLIARAYVRVSTEEQAMSGYSLAAQRERLAAFAASQGWTLASIYADDGCSAKDLKRPALQAMLADARSGEVILVYKLDRLTRSVLDLYRLLQTFDQRSLLFRSATEEFNTTTPHGRLMITLVAVIAQWERETIAERVKMGRQKKAASGEWPGGPVPFGYTTEPSGQIKGGRHLLRLVPDAGRASLVQQLFVRYLSGQGMRALCIWLNEELGARTACGGRWRVESVRRVLTNPLYCGCIVHGRRTGEPETWATGNHEPLVPRELFDQVQNLLRVHRDAAPRQATGSYPLAGVARCGVCGGRVGVDVNHKAGLYYYKCLNYHKGVGCGERPLTSIPGHYAEAEVVSRIADLLPPEWLPALLQQFARDPSLRPDEASMASLHLEADLRAARHAIQRWDLAYETGRISLADYLERVSPHRHRLRVIAAQMEALPPRLPPALPAPASIDFRVVWAEASPPERKALLQHFVRSFGLQILLAPDRQVALACPH